jgi:hypothetical protein
MIGAMEASPGLLTDLYELTMAPIMVEPSARRGFHGTDHGRAVGGAALLTSLMAVVAFRYGHWSTT